MLKTCGLTVRGSRLKPGLLFRSARPDGASSKDRQRLRDDYGVKTIIDLRSKYIIPVVPSFNQSISLTLASRTEHLEQARKRSANPTIDPTTPIKIPGITYAEINFNGSSFSYALMRRLPLLSSARLIALMALGYRTAAISILGTQVMGPRGLAGLGHDSLLHCTAEINAIFTILSETQNWPLLVHCTQGKDRTGLTVLLVLMLCGVDMDAIKADYITSQRELEVEREERLGEIRSIGLPDGFADCPDEWVERMVDFVDEEMGCVERYLEERCGVGREMQDRVKKILLRETSSGISG